MKSLVPYEDRNSGSVAQLTARLPGKTFRASKRSVLFQRCVIAEQEQQQRIGAQKLGFIRSNLLANVTLNFITQIAENSRADSRPSA